MFSGDAALQKLPVAQWVFNTEAHPLPVWGSEAERTALDSLGITPTDFDPWSLPLWRGQAEPGARPWHDADRRRRLRPPPPGILPSLGAASGSGVGGGMLGDSPEDEEFLNDAYDLEGEDIDASGAVGGGGERGGQVE
eukprot:263578-Chlamydomonas_euryale.AAC.6